MILSNETWFPMQQLGLRNAFWYSGIPIRAKKIVGPKILPADSL
jgi:hypothetical protein